MINKTYLEYYGKFRDQFNPEEYMQCVDEGELVKRFGSVLEHNEENLLTRYTMPWFDLGDIPSTHSFMRSEAEQSYYVPHNRNPDLIYVKYSMFLPKYVSADPKKRFDDSSLPSREVHFKQFEETIQQCTLHMKNYRGRILMYELGGWAAVILAFLILIIIAISTASSDSANWGGMVLYILLFFIFVPVVLKTAKCFQNKYLR